MSKNTIIILMSCIAIILVIAVVLLLVFTPQIKPTTIGFLTEYEQINKSDYTYDPLNKNIESELIEEYSVTENKVSSGLAAKYYTEGNDNPFTPPKDFTGTNPVDPYSENIK